MEIVLYSLIAVFSLTGLATIIRAAAFAFFSSSWKTDFFCIVRLYDEDFEIALRDAAEQISWGSCRCGSIIAADYGLNRAQAEAAMRLCEDYGIEYCAASKLSQRLDKG